jgi:hypothetical protein
MSNLQKPACKRNLYPFANLIMPSPSHDHRASGQKYNPILSASVNTPIARNVEANNAKISSILIDLSLVLYVIW